MWKPRQGERLCRACPGEGSAAHSATCQTSLLVYVSHGFLLFLSEIGNSPRSVNSVLNIFYLKWSSTLLILCQGEDDAAFWAGVRAFHPLPPLGAVTSVSVEYTGSAQSLVKKHEEIEHQAAQQQINPLCAVVTHRFLVGNEQSHNHTPKSGRRQNRKLQGAFEKFHFSRPNLALSLNTRYEPCMVAYTLNSSTGKQRQANLLHSWPA